MKIGLLADIHSNADALAAVLKKAQKINIEKLLIAGDLVGYYYELDRVLTLLDDWEWTAIGGNHEAMLQEWLLGKRHKVIREKYGSSFEVACNKVSRSVLKSLSELPENQSLSVDGKSVFMCHGSPWDRDKYIYPDADEDIVNRMFGKGVKLTLFGHTHYPVHWQYEYMTVVNPGSVGQPRDYLPGACWAMWDTRSERVELRREYYDSSRLIKNCQLRDPDLPYLAEVLDRT